jgi:hypothetical protein
MSHKRTPNAKYRFGATQGIGCITNGLGFIHSSWKTSTPNGANLYRQFPVRFAVKPITKPRHAPMPRKWGFENQPNKKSSDYQIGAFYFSRSQ